MIRGDLFAVVRLTRGAALSSMRPVHAICSFCNEHQERRVSLCDFLF